MKVASIFLLQFSVKFVQVFVCSFFDGSLSLQLLVLTGCFILRVILCL